MTSHPFLGCISVIIHKSIVLSVLLMKLEYIDRHFKWRLLCIHGNAGPSGVFLELKYAGILTERCRFQKGYKIENTTEMEHGIVNN